MFKTEQYSKCLPFTPNEALCKKADATKTAY